MPNEKPFIKIEIQQDGAVLMHTNIVEPGLVNLYLDFAKSKLIEAVLTGPQSRVKAATPNELNEIERVGPQRMN